MKSKVWYIKRQIPGYEGKYKASNRGEVWYKDKRNGKWVKRKQSMMSNGYPAVNLFKDRKSNITPIHTIVLQTFIGPRPKGMYGRHFPDGNKMNNRLDNLSYGTPKQNSEDKKLQGTYEGGIAYGEKSVKAKMSNKKVILMRRMFLTGKYSVSELGRFFNIHNSQAWRIIHRKVWRHI